MTQEQLLHYLKQNPFVLAPMAGITDKPFRSLMRELGCGLVVTELVSATGLKFNSSRTRRLMEFSADQHPVGVQLFGEELSHLAEAAMVVQDLGADFVDINFGCPVPKVVKRGAGSACLKDLPQLARVIHAVRSSVQIPVTIKVRTGWDQPSRNTPEVIRIAYNEGVTWVAIHGRTRAAGYSGLADWDYIREVKRSSLLPVIGNGDILTAKQAVARLQTSGCDAVMIGRGCLRNPWIFQQARDLVAMEEDHKSSALASENVFDLLERMRQHLASFYDDRLTALQIKKFAAWYSAGYPSSAEFRRRIFRSQALTEVMHLAQDYFATIAHMAREDLAQEPFLQGGHG